MSLIYRVTDPVVVKPVTIAVNTDFFSTPLVIKPGALFPGGGGILRVWFAVVTNQNAETAIEVSITNPAGTLPVKDWSFFVNADNGFVIKSGGIYWFDVPIIDGSSIQMQSTTSFDGAVTGRSITAITLLEFQKITAGA